MTGHHLAPKTLDTIVQQRGRIQALKHIRSHTGCNLATARQVLAEAISPDTSRALDARYAIRRALERQAEGLGVDFNDYANLSNRELHALVDQLQRWEV